MTSRRPPTVPRPTAAQPAAVAALGDALASRAGDGVRMCQERRRALGAAELGSADFRARRDAAQLLGVQLFARWLRTGETITREERKRLGELGEHGARSGVSISDMTRGFLLFRDVTLELIAEEAERLETPPDILERVGQLVRYSCDGSVLWMTRNFDRHKELQAAEEKRLNAELAASEERFRTLFESIACGVTVFSPDGTVLGSNDSVGAMFGLPAETMIGVSLHSAPKIYEDESGAVLSEFPTAEALRTRGAVHGRVVKHDLGDGRPVRWYQVDSVPIFDGESELTHVVTTYVDVTAVKAAEELRAESAAKSRFLATMSHELRTPLNSILGFAQLLRIYESGKLDPTQRRYVGNIETSGAHLLALISDILELSKVAAGQVVLKVEDVEVAAAIRKVAEEFEPMLAGTPVQLKLELGAKLVARVDRLRFRQVVVNLVANALKFTSSGAVTIATRKRARQLELRVADTGIGIPSDQIERVFDEFTQVDSSETRTHGGTGLGLPLTRQLVEMMGGTVVLDSELGRGTTATVLLPLG